ncbi:MAG TPA: PaaI family thioesterase [Gammaproteobacteria bacterium]|nr:PaaI family thioesterase [Gammaproteobacteria bacterium]
MTFKVRNEAYANLVSENFSRQNLMKTLGAELAHIAPGEISIAMPYSRDFCQQNGFLHAGAISSIADSANGYAALTLCEADMDVLAVEFKINLLAPAKAPRFLAEGRVLRPGRTLTVCMAHVYGLDGSERIAVATMLSTLIHRPISTAR